MRLFVTKFIAFCRCGPCRGWLAIFLAANLFISLPNNTNPRSRLATLCAMAEDQSFRIDNYQNLTTDWARTPNGHYYSNKAPGPMLLGYPVFWAVDRMLNHNQPDRARRDHTRLEYSWLLFKVLSVLFQVIPFFALVVIALQWLESRGVSRPALHVSCVAMLFGNTATLFMNTYFGHAMAANCVLARVHPPSPWPPPRIRAAKRGTNGWRLARPGAPAAHINFNSVSAMWDGVGATEIPASLKAAILAAAVPLPPLMIAPAWPMRRPGGAVAPAMKPATGLRQWSLIHAAASSSDVPPISPIMMIPCVSGSSLNIFTMSKCVVPLTGSPPMPTQVDCPTPRWVSCQTAS